MTPDQLDGSGRAGRIQTVVIGHDLLPLRVGEHLVAPQAVAVGQAQGLATLTAHRIQAVVRRLILDVVKARKIDEDR